LQCLREEARGAKAAKNWPFRERPERGRAFAWLIVRIYRMEKDTGW
jgi:hypothetical protein